MRWYASDTPGTGGRLRTVPEDFVVEEVPAGVGAEGPYLICRLTKKDWELQRAVREIARQLGISHRRIGWAGTKDKHAVTSQLISIYQVSPEMVAHVHLKDLALEPVGQSPQPLALGSHQSNRFRIVIRDTCSGDLDGEAAAVSRACGEGLPNYFGLQRFGVVRPVTHRVGEFLLKGDYEGAVACYVGYAYPGEPPAVREARTRFLENRDPVEGLHNLPVPLTYERAMLNYLAARPGDYKGALLSLPPRLLSMFVSAFQSWLFNLALSARMERGAGLGNPHPGDRLLFPDGRTDQVTPANLHAASIQVARGRCRVALMMPGSRPADARGEDDRVLAGLRDAHGITPEHFAAASSFVGVRYEGALRPASLVTHVDCRIDDRDLTLSFSLEPGQYATTLCREFMKADPASMI
jgi:tRNA pseudouridine13 synthase